MAEAVPEFGLAAMDVKGILEWTKADLGSANAPGQLFGSACCSKCPVQFHEDGCCTGVVVCRVHGERPQLLACAMIESPSQVPR